LGNSNMNRFVEVLKELKRHRGSAIACPQCRSLNIYKSSGMDGWLLPPLYLCPDCGYSGRVVVELQGREVTRGGSRDGANAAER
jgi:predicted RNA-binding Zn-ribbon protein involved in translation (DUF1610 family)